jgi:hypothetical protein
MNNKTPPPATCPGLRGQTCTMYNTVSTRAHRRCVASAVTLALALGLAAATSASAEQGKGKGKGNSEGKGKSADWVPPGHRRAPVEIVVTAAPPAVRKETMPARPSSAHVWVAGYWVWQSDAYAWTPGVWMQPPEPEVVWVAPRHEVRSGVTIYISGFWRL